MFASAERKYVNFEVTIDIIKLRSICFIIYYNRPIIDVARVCRSTVVSLLYHYIAECLMKRAVHCIASLVLNDVMGSRTGCPASKYINTRTSANMRPIDVRSKPTCFKLHALLAMQCDNFLVGLLFFKLIISACHTFLCVFSHDHTCLLVPTHTPTPSYT